MIRPPCRHCLKSPANRPRGLCWCCYYTPGVRERYTFKDSPYAHRGVGLGNHTRPLPAVPTAHRPGTPEKMAVLAARVAAGEALWHPADAMS